ncbi:hypothetical protein BCR42DRAFT_408497 [Absidia repens]|uniref:Uncharacterized protein n=1 Tax=Absidia repens TaxID=90262 RepID=A0A1X2IPX1_9FUNG|nr:hypothetical protein BCR42DRAFT_408497 [Absidia repens]
MDKNIYIISISAIFGFLFSLLIFPTTSFPFSIFFFFFSFFVLFDHATFLHQSRISMPRRKDRLLFRSPSPGIRRIPEPTSPPPPPRIQRTRPLELPSRTTVANLNERLTSTLYANSSTTSSSCSPIGQSQPRSSSPSSASSSPSKSSSPSSTASSSSPQRLYESCLYRLYDRNDSNRTATSISSSNQPLSGWEALLASSDTSDTSDTSSQNSYQHLSITPISSPQRTTSQTSPCRISSSSSPTQQNTPKSIANIVPTASPHRPSSQQYTSCITSPSSPPSSSSNTPISSSRRASSQSPRKHKVGLDRKYPSKRSPQRLSDSHPPPSSLIMTRPQRYSNTPTVDSDTSEEEVEPDTKPRPLWMNRLRSRQNKKNNLSPNNATNNNSNNNSNSSSNNSNNNNNSNSNSHNNRKSSANVGSGNDSNSHGRGGGKSHIRKSRTSINNANKTKQMESSSPSSAATPSSFIKRQLRSRRIMASMDTKKSGK